MLITNIGVLVGSDGGDTLFLRGKEMSTIGLIENAWLRTEKDRFSAFGSMDSCPEAEPGELCIGCD